MSKIATELEARTMGGGTLSVTNNKCCTKARALELGCQIKSGYSYTDTQLVEIESLESASVIPILRLRCRYYDMTDIIGTVFRFRTCFVSDLGEGESTPYIEVPITRDYDDQFYEVSLKRPLLSYVDTLIPPNASISDISFWLKLEIQLYNSPIDASGSYNLTTPGFEQDIELRDIERYWNLGNTSGTKRTFTGKEEVIINQIQITRL